jgi:hypothetical protein
MFRQVTSRLERSSLAQLRYTLSSSAFVPRYGGSWPTCGATSRRFWHASKVRALGHWDKLWETVCDNLW